MTIGKFCKCCICGKKFTGFGNNPYPISVKEEDRCCDACNFTAVIPTRLAMMRKGKVN